MKNNPMIQTVLDDVIQEIAAKKSIMTDDHISLWDDVIDHIIKGSSFVESMLFSFVDSCIYNQIEALTIEEQEGLWWETTPGKNMEFEVEWAQKHSSDQLDKLGVPESEEMRDNIVDFLRNELGLRAEAEAMKRETGY
ncbi:MAG: hypothetical protein PHY78_11950 [Desulfobacterales bacterium]|nr:hypothetical protein [Desulfobacterales bacterium]MDD4394136.1 hypothetical protein [Desulfobacterales bacterium]